MRSSQIDICNCEVSFREIAYIKKQYFSMLFI